ncbi:hypothetical protein G7075_01445 [Phycicoccus sp. HDW14]|uniref:hypothetical protein n=1 Tax=Phycicoccus sp. HDW14 TaxID=2714941 RepID=UPI001409B273|nr:hypothetical protein [Phycicoccus sp. HDW14]QIM20116.1 hypothetical protein G7075_01445 [Phycicoccus sp. HDW14]
MLIAVIITCEVLFWVLVLAGLATRYLLRRPRLGGWLLVAAPLVDLVLLAATVLDLRGGATATTAHALAAVYLGVSVGFGHSMVRWADARFAHRYAGGPAPERAPRTGRAHAARERRGLARHLVAFAVGAGLLGLAVLVIGDPSRTGALTQMLRLWGLVVAVDALVSLSYTVRPRPTEVGARR